VRGSIFCEWRQEANSFKLEVRIPANTTATVLIPARSANDVTERGRALAQADGVKLLRQENDRTVIAVESGEYRFESKH
jgi:alpha-L-rhamnosidase